MRLLPLILTLGVLARAQSNTTEPSVAASSPSAESSPSETASDTALSTAPASVNETSTAGVPTVTDSTATGLESAGNGTAVPLPTVTDLSNGTTVGSDTATLTSAPEASSTTAATAAECSFCTVPAGYTSEDVPAPLDIEDSFSPAWRKAHRKAAAYLKGWTNEDKAKLATGEGWMVGRCVGNTPPVAERNWTGLCLQDAPLGVRFGDFVSYFPPAINVASTFDKSLMYKRGYAMGQEHRGKGVNIQLGPMTNMGRVAAGGRNWEGFGADPYLSGHGTYQTVKGIQKAGVQACAKHFILNEQERNRTTSSSNVDDRTLHEFYLHPFLRAVQADVASFMCSYNLINGSWACQDSKTQNGILKTELGFGGFIMSDWDATHSGVLSVQNGLDMTMPGDIGYSGGLTTFFGANLTNSVTNGSIPQARLDDMAQRIVAAWYLVGQDKGNYPAVNFDSWTTTGPNNSHVDVQGDHYKLIRHIGASSVVLLKNVDNALPLVKPKSIAVIGSDMGPSTRGPNGYSDRGGDEGTLASGWGSGTTNFPYLVDPLEAISLQARKDHSTLGWWLRDWEVEGAATLAATAEVAIVGINSDSGEEYITVDGNIGDRNNLTAWNNGDALVKAVAAVNNNTIVVIHSVGPIIMDWADHPNITGILWAGLPGQESGNSLVDVMYGAYNPSGRLPYTIARNRSDYPADIDYVNTNDPVETNVEYTEGLFVDYRHFLAQNITPAFPFGYGGSYTNFSYSNIKVTPLGRGKRDYDLHDRESIPVNSSVTSVHESQTAAPATNTDISAAGNNVTDPAATNSSASDNSTSTPPTAQVGTSVSKKLHKARWSVSADITNTGAVNGCEIPQLYLSFPEGSGEPPRVLRDFTRINLDANATSTVTFKLSRYDVSIWNVVEQAWTIPNGTFTAIVARHSFDEDGVSATFTP